MKILNWMLKAKKIVLLLASLIIGAVSFAQDKSATEELMRSNGKIYVVVAVCLTILAGLFVYVFLIDRKINKLEKEN